MYFQNAVKNFGYILARELVLCILSNMYTCIITSFTCVITLTIFFIYFFVLKLNSKIICFLVYARGNIAVIVENKKDKDKF